MFLIDALIEGIA